MERSICSFAYVIFDGDGTLWRGQTIYRKILPYLLWISLGWSTPGMWLPSGTIPVPPWIRWTGSIPGAKQLVKQADRLTSQALASAEGFVGGRPLYAETEEILERLASQGKALFLSTGSPNPRGFLQKRGLLPYFQATCGVEIGKQKHIPLFANALGMSLEEFAPQACIISDGPFDLCAARGHGIYSIGLARTLTARQLLRSGADTIISNLRDLF